MFYPTSFQSLLNYTFFEWNAYVAEIIISKIILESIFLPTILRIITQSGQLVCQVIFTKISQTRKDKKIKCQAYMFGCSVDTWSRDAFSRWAAINNYCLENWFIVSEQQLSYCGDVSHGTVYVFRGCPLGQSFLELKRIWSINQMTVFGLHL